jgi:very-short-patch-repair endonuclease
MARLQGPDGPENKEADFLVCYNGTWGLLEVDGEPFHPPSRVAWDHARDRLFRAHGIKVVEHFDATECYRDPDSVIVRFLEILRNASS